MATKLKQLLDELTMLKEYFAQDLLVNGLTEMVVLKDDLEELIDKYTETTPVKEIVYTEAEVAELFHQAGYYYDNNIVSPTEWFNQNRKEIN